MFTPYEEQKSVNNRSIRYTLTQLSPVLLATLPACNPLPFLENGGAVGILVTVIGVSTYFMYHSHEKKGDEDSIREYEAETKRLKRSQSSKFAKHGWLR